MGITSTSISKSSSFKTIRYIINQFRILVHEYIKIKNMHKKQITIQLKKILKVNLLPILYQSKELLFRNI